MLLGIVMHKYFIVNVLICMARIPDQSGQMYYCADCQQIACHELYKEEAARSGSLLCRSAGRKLLHALAV